MKGEYTLASLAAISPSALPPGAIVVSISAPLMSRTPVAPAEPTVSTMTGNDVNEASHSRSAARAKGSISVLTQAATLDTEIWPEADSG
jgi:hypothetical protein